MGVNYWASLEKSRPEHVEEKNFDPRHVQILLRTYKTGGVAAILTHTGDPSVALKDWFESEDIKKEMEVTEGKALSEENVRFRFEKIKETVEKVKQSKAVNRKVRKLFLLLVLSC